MPSINSRLPDVSTSIFAVMSKMALENNAINLSQGFPDFAIDEKIIELVHRHMVQGHNQYAPMPGVMALREVIANVIQRSYGVAVSPEHEITITAGATQALHVCISAFISPGDEVIMFDPAYDSYEPAVRLNGGKAVRINLQYPDFTIDWTLVEKSITPKTRAIITNTPHNPTGTVFTEEDIRNLERIAEKNDLVVISDEVYERLIFDKIPHRSVLGSEVLRQRSVAVFSFGKTFHATGWKCGYTVAPPALTAEIRKAHQFIVFSVHTPTQWALSEYMRDPAHYENLGMFYQRKRDFFLEKTKGTSLRPIPCHGSYFQVMSYEGFSKKPDVDVAEELTRVHKIATIPLSVFYKDRSDNRLLRFCFAKKEETIERAAEILRKI